MIRVGTLPDEAVEAAAEFYRAVQPNVIKALRIARQSHDGGDAHLTLLFRAAAYDHRGWRLAAVQDLARAAAPVRLNAIVGDDEVSIAETAAWLSAAPGVTGQLFAVDGKSGKNA